MSESKKDIKTISESSTSKLLKVGNKYFPIDKVLYLEQDNIYLKIINVFLVGPNQITIEFDTEDEANDELKKLSK
jgi:hypothetical protein